MAGTPITKVIDLTPSVFENWMDGDHNNRGWMMKLKSGSTTLKTFKSSEFGSLEPYIIIECEPYPSIKTDCGLALLGCGS